MGTTQIRRTAPDEETPLRTPADRPTEPPPFDPAQFARDSESQLVSQRGDDRRATMPPTSAHGRLRDSCQDLVAVVAEETKARAAPKELPLFSKPTLGSVAVLLVGQEDLEWFHLEPSARALLSRVDGRMIVEELLAIARTDVAEGLATLEALADAGLVAFGLRSSRSIDGNRTGI